MPLIDHFLRVGEFGAIKIGISYEVVLSVLGEPEDRGYRRAFNRGGGMWKYGPLEIGFLNKQVNWILISVFRGGLLPGVTTEQLPFARSTTLSDFKHYLDKHSIGFQEGGTSKLFGDRGNGPIHGIKCGLGTYAYFNTEDAIFEKIISSQESLLVGHAKNITL